MSRHFWEYCICNEHEILREIKNAKEDNGPSQKGGHTGISNPTQALAMRHLRPVREIKINNFFVIKQPEMIIDAIRYVRSVVNINRELGPIYNARYADKEKYEVTCSRLHITSTTYNKRVLKIIDMLDNKLNRLRGKKNGN